MFDINVPKIYKSYGTLHRFNPLSEIFFVGWELKDWTEGDREKLIAEFPHHKELFVRLTKHK